MTWIRVEMALRSVRSTVSTVWICGRILPDSPMISKIGFIFGGDSLTAAVRRVADWPSPGRFRRTENATAGIRDTMSSESRVRKTERKLADRVGLEMRVALED